MYLVNVNDTVFTIQTLEWLQQLFILEYKFAIIAVDYMMGSLRPTKLGQPDRSR